MSNDTPYQGVQSFSVDAIRDRILPDSDLTPAERLKRLCHYIEEDYDGWRARHIPDPELSAHFAKILMTKHLARIELFFEVLPTKSPMVVQANIFFLDYDVQGPSFSEKCLQDHAIKQSIAQLTHWLEAQTSALKL